MGVYGRYQIWKTKRRDEHYVFRLCGFRGTGGYYRPGLMDAILNRDRSHPSGKMDPGSGYFKSELEDLRNELDDHKECINKLLVDVEKLKDEMDYK